MTKITKITKKEADSPDWYRISGTDPNTGHEFSGEVYGVLDDGTIVDEEGCPLSDCEWADVAAHNCLD